jgi:acyl carrier protein
MNNLTSVGARMTETTAINDRIKEFILRKFPLAKKQGIKNSDRMLDSGILDSLGVLDVVAFVEQEFAILVSDEDLTPENFQSLDSLTAFVQRKSSNGSGPGA